MPILLPHVEVLDTSALIARRDAALGFTLGAVPQAKEPIMGSQQTTKYVTRTPARTPQRRWRKPLVVARTAIIVGLIGLGIAFVVGVFESESDVAETPEGAAVYAMIDAYNAHDYETYASYWAEGAREQGDLVGSPDWMRTRLSEKLVGTHKTLSDCTLTGRPVRVTCNVNIELAALQGRAGIVWTGTLLFRFNDAGQLWSISDYDWTGGRAEEAFNRDFGQWMETAHTDVFDDCFKPVVRGVYRPDYDYWFTPDGVAVVSPLIDEFIAQSDDYPLTP